MEHADDEQPPSEPARSEASSTPENTPNTAGDVYPREADRLRWEQDLIASKGEEWMRQNGERLQEEWEYIQIL